LILYFAWRAQFAYFKKPTHLKHACPQNSQKIVILRGNALVANWLFEVAQLLYRKSQVDWLNAAASSRLVFFGKLGTAVHLEYAVLLRCKLLCLYTYRAYQALSVD